MKVKGQAWRGLAWDTWVLAGLALLAWVVASLVLGISPAQADGSAPGKYGQLKLYSVDMPVEALAKISLFAAKPSKGTGLLADSQDWRGDTLNLAKAGNPYTVVLRVEGQVVADGDVSSIWQTGWNEDGRSRISRLPKIGSSGAKAGSLFSGEAAATPVSFEKDSQFAPEIGFVKADNLRVQKVTLEVWSGMRSTRWWESVLSFAKLLVGLVALGLFVWWRKR